MKNIFCSFPVLLISLILIPALQAQQNEKSILTTSPDGHASVVVAVGEKLLISVLWKGSRLIEPSELGLKIREYPAAFNSLSVNVIRETTVDQVIIPPVPEKRNIIPDHYNQTEIWFRSDVGLRVVAYDDGVAWRFLTRFPGVITIENETATLNLAPSDSVYFGEEDSFVSHSERMYKYLSVNDITEKQWCVLPLTIRSGSGVIAAFSEADLADYPGLYMKGTGNGNFTGIFPTVVRTEKISSDKRSFIPDERENYIARVDGTREFPWRLVGIADNDAQLIENDIVYRLGRPCGIQETNWIRPGKVAWDWWNDWNLYNVPFKAGINTDTYKCYIDFAAKYGLEYVIFDEGWSANDDLDKVNPDMGMDSLFAYSRQKNVGIILWVTGRALEEKFESAMDKFEKWGVAGIKVDFLVRDDQRMVNYFEKVAAAAAERKMLVDFHGSFKPTGLSRTYPNQLTREGVKGLENSKWSNLITPEHDCTIPFTRMFAGPMDYTPGAMVNSSEKSFKIDWSQPMSMGTRCHELAKYIIFESPLQMLCDVPMNYEREPEAMQFLATVPTIWDKTIGIDARIGEYLTVARCKDSTWYLGAMTDQTPREFEIMTDFLDNGMYKMEVWKDGPNSVKRAVDFTQETLMVDKNTKISINLASGGGYVARFTKQ